MAFIELSVDAAQHLRDLVQKESDPENTRLRISVQSGGCHGFQYAFAFDVQLNPEDKVFEKEGAVVVIDENSLEILKGSILDYKDDLMGASFVLKNPNANGSCGCGNSFSI